MDKKLNTGHHHSTVGMLQTVIKQVLTNSNKSQLILKLLPRPTCILTVTLITNCGMVDEGMTK